MEDLFQTPILLPTEVQVIIEKYSDMDTTYENCQLLVDELEQVGYTCDYGLDGIPYDLRKKGESFDFYVDTKVTTWYRTNFSIEGINEEDAKLKAIEFLNSGERDILPWEQIDDTIETMEPGDNDGQPTEELYDKGGNVIWDNIKTN
jgi:hypothetical protein